MSLEYSSNDLLLFDQESADDAVTHALSAAGTAVRASDVLLALRLARTLHRPSTLDSEELLFAVTAFWNRAPLSQVKVDETTTWCFGAAKKVLRQ